MKRRKDYGNSADDWFLSLDYQLKSIAIKLRRLIKNSVPEITETIKWGMPNYEKDVFVCALRAGNGYIALQFGDLGVSLDDPNFLLEGSGKKRRHIKVWREIDIKEKLFISWIKKAAKK